MGFTFREPAVPTIDREKCSRCGRCAEACSTGKLVKEDGDILVAKGSFMDCIACGHCMTVCPKGAIRVSGRRFSPEDVVDLPPRSEQATPDQLDALLLARRSVRKFTDQEINRADVDRILAMTSTAPMGIPPTEVGVVVFHGREKVREFTAQAMASFESTLKFLNPVMLTLMRPFMGREDAEAMKEFILPLLRQLVVEWKAGNDYFAYEAPLALLFHRSRFADVADPHIATTYAMLAAQSLGLGSCMLGTTLVLDHNAAFKARYGIPKRNKIGLGLVIGHPDRRFDRGIRRQFADVRFA
jgi:ferredoxin